MAIQVHHEVLTAFPWGTSPFGNRWARTPGRMGEAFRDAPFSFHKKSTMSRRIMYHCGGAPGEGAKRVPSFERVG